MSRGPALLLGGFLLVAGLFFLYRAHTFPRLGQFPSGDAHVSVHAFFGVFGINGWTGELTAAAGGVLLLGAAEHYLAKAASLIVGVVLAGVAIIALVHHHSALGLFAANIWTELLFLASAVYLAFNLMMPRAGGVTETTAVASEPAAVAASEPATVATTPARSTAPVAGDPVAADDAATVPAEPVASGGRHSLRSRTSRRPATRTRGAAPVAAEGTRRPIRTEPITGSGGEPVDDAD